MRFIFILVCTFIICADQLVAQTQLNKSYLKDLIINNEYQIAYQESNRLLFVYPNDNFLLRINMFTSVELGYNIYRKVPAEMYWEYLIFKFDSNCYKNRKDDELIRARNVPVKYEKYYNNRKLFALVIYDNVNNGITLNGIELTYFSKLRQKYSYIEYNPNYSLLFSMIPGGGYLYNNEYTDAVITMLSTVICSSISLYAIKNNNKPIGVMFASLGLLFYTSGYIGSYNQANSKNDISKKKTSVELMKYLNFKQDRVDLIYEK